MSACCFSVQNDYLLTALFSTLLCLLIKKQQMSIQNNRSDIVIIQKISALCFCLFPHFLLLFSFFSTNRSLSAPSICSRRLASAFMSRARVCVCMSVCLCLCVTYCPHMKVNIISVSPHYLLLFPFPFFNVWKFLLLLLFFRQGLVYPRVPWNFWSLCL